MDIHYLITDNIDYPVHESHLLIHYSSEPTTKKAFVIHPQGLLFENDIRQQSINIFKFDSLFDEKEKVTAFFKTANASFPFDIFSAIFFLLSRYEEYWPHQKDSYGRYAHENAIAFQHGFLHLPLINCWLAEFRKSLHQTGVLLLFKPNIFKAGLTYDIDIAWSYLNKGLLRNFGGFIKRPSWERIQVLLGKKQDPFDCYDFLISLHKKIDEEAICFFPLAENTGLYDKNIDPQRWEMQQLVDKMHHRFTIGLHPSWHSHAHPEALTNELNTLEKIVREPVVHSRQHYIKFDLPSTYQRLSDIGIRKDYSMGYGSINGFRASFAGSFFWYDLSNETQTLLELHPFCFMDANSHYEQKQSLEDTKQELEHYLSVCKKYKGEFISIFHNNFLGTGKEFKGWRELYLHLISQLRQ